MKALKIFGVFAISALLVIGVLYTTHALYLGHVLSDISNGASVSDADLIKFTNDERVEHDLTALATSTLLSQAAQAKAEDMAKRQYFSHYTPEGKAPWYWLKEAKYTYTHAGENLAVNFSDSKDVVEAWMNSPLHRANILKNGYNEIGVGYAEGVYKNRKAIYIVQFFGTQGTSTAFATSGAGVFEGFSRFFGKIRNAYVSWAYGVEYSATQWDNPNLP